MRKPLRQHVRMMDRGLHKQGNPSCAARRVESKNLKERSCTSASSAERIGAFGYGVSLGAGRLGRWYCAEHRPGVRP